MSIEPEELDEHFKKPTFTERLGKSFGSFFKDGFKGAAIGLVVGVAVGTAFALSAPLITGAALVGGTMAAIGKIALISALFGGALHATMGAIEVFSNANNELEVNKEKTPEPARAKEPEKGLGLALSKEAEAPGMEAAAKPSYRDMVAQRRSAQSQQVEQRY